MRGRYAPSPTGALHLGNARTALLAWLASRKAGGSFVMRIEDLDRERVLMGGEARILDDLAWLGIDWDEGPDRGGARGPYRQSERLGGYQEALRSLQAAGRSFPCACSRADVARVATAPHDPSEEGPRYPGTCRALSPDEVRARAAALGRAPTLRFDGRQERIGFVDGLHGPVAGEQGGIDDFILQRADGVFAYQLAVVVDDAAMGITSVMRGDDLLPSTPRQLALYQALGLAPPRFAHVPLVLTPSGQRLTKRIRPLSLVDLRQRGVDPALVVGVLAASARLCPPGSRLMPRDLIAGFDLARVPKTPVALPDL